LNNDDPPPSPKIKANGLSKESFITSSEVSYGTDQNLFPERYNHERVRPQGLQRLTQSGVDILRVASAFGQFCPRGCFHHSRPLDDLEF